MHDLRLANTSKCLNLWKAKLSDYEKTVFLFFHFIDQHIFRANTSFWDDVQTIKKYDPDDQTPKHPICLWETLPSANGKDCRSLSEIITSSTAALAITRWLFFIDGNWLQRQSKNSYSTE
jgi:hypothetical protein